MSTYKWYVPCVHQTTTHVSQDPIPGILPATGRWGLPTSAPSSQTLWWTISPKQALFGKSLAISFRTRQSQKSPPNQKNMKIPRSFCTLYLARFLAKTFDSPFGVAVSPLSRHRLRNAMVGFMFGDWWGIGRAQAISALHPTKNESCTQNAYTWHAGCHMYSGAACLLNDRPSH